MKQIALACVLVLLAACGTTDSQLQQSGHSQGYITGFHDGRHSGMQEQGNSFEHYIRDHERYSSDPEYKAGWDEGEAEGIKLQAQATAIGTGAAAGMTASSVGKQVDKQTDGDRAARKALKHTDTSGLENLGK